MTKQQLSESNRSLREQNRLLKVRLARVEREFQSAVNILDPEQVRLAKINLKILQHEH